MQRKVENINFDRETFGSFGRIKSHPGIKSREMYQSFEGL